MIRLVLRPHFSGAPQSSPRCSVSLPLWSCSVSVIASVNPITLVTRAQMLAVRPLSVTDFAGHLNGSLSRISCFPTKGWGVGRVLSYRIVIIQCANKSTIVTSSLLRSVKPSLPRLWHGRNQSICCAHSLKIRAWGERMSGHCGTSQRLIKRERATYSRSLRMSRHIVNVVADELASSASSDERPDLSEALWRTR